MTQPPPVCVCTCGQMSLLANELRLMVQQEVKVNENRTVQLNHALFKFTPLLNMYTHLIANLGMPSQNKHSLMVNSSSSDAMFSKTVVENFQDDKIQD